MSSVFISPAIKITESFENRGVVPVAENAFVAGYTRQGPSELPYFIDTVNDWVNLFGKPDPSAPEQAYAYNAAESIINSGANLIFTRLPYGADEGDTVGDLYSALVYPVQPCLSGEESVVGYKSTAFVPATAFGDGGDYQALSGSTWGTSNDDIFSGTVFTVSEWSSFTDTDFTATISLSAAINATEVVGSTDDALLFGEPAHATLSQDDLDAIECGEFNWSDTFTADKGVLSAYDASTFGQAGMVVIDKSRSITNRQFEGYYLTVTDNYDSDPATVWNAVSGVQYANDQSVWANVPATFYNFPLTGDEVSNNIAISRTVESLGNNGVEAQWENDEFKDHLNVTLWRLVPNEGDVNDLVPVVVESHVGSLDSERTVSDFGVPKSVFLQNTIERDSNRLKIYINPNISTERTDWEAINGSRTLAVRMLRDELNSTLKGCAGGMDYTDNMYSLSRYVPKTNAVARDIGNLPAKLARALCSIDNPEVIDIDYTVDAGLSTIWTTVKTDRTQWVTNNPDANTYIFNDGVNIDVLGDLGRIAQVSNGGNGGRLRTLWQTIFDQFENFVSQTRPCNGGTAAVHVADPLRHIFVQGRDCKVWKGDKDADNTFNELIYHPLKNLLAGANTSHAVTYANWYKDVIIGAGNKICWVPPSGKMTQVIANTPTVWTAPAGVNNGIVDGVKDMAINPRLRDRDQLYKIQANAVYNDRDYGNIAFAQQTLNRPNTMARELYVRRTLLWLQKNAIRIVKPFQFEPNTVFVRTRLRNALNPHYQRALNGGALEDYQISFDANTPNELQLGILKISFLLKFAGLIKFVRLDYHSVNSETPFTEVILN